MEVDVVAHRHAPSLKEAEMKNISISIFLFITLTVTVTAQVSATFDGDTVKIWDAGFDWSCSGKFFPITAISHDTIYITECDTMRLATCSCYFTVYTSLSGLKAGTYTAVVTRQHIEHVTFPIDTIYVSKHFAGSVTFTVLTPPSLPSKVSLYQSGCNSFPGSVMEESKVPSSFAMLTNYPNPFNPKTTIRFTIPKTVHVSLAIYTMAGQHVAALVDEEKHFGNYEINYNAENLPSGVYVCRLKYGERSLSRKLVLVK